jgi:hypothetical protein
VYSRRVLHAHALHNLAKDLFEFVNACVMAGLALSSTNTFKKVNVLPGQCVGLLEAGQLPSLSYICRY